MSKICSSCNAENVDEANFCRKCGSQDFKNNEPNTEQVKATKSNQIIDNSNSSSNLLKTIVIVIVIVLVLIILVGAITASLMLTTDSQKKVMLSPKNNVKSITSYSSKKLSEIRILYPLDTFIIKLKSDAGRRYLKVTMSLEVNGEELSLELDAKSAVLRDRIIRILTSKTLEEISSKKGKVKVTNQIMDTLNSMIVGGSIEGIYITEFVIQ